MIVVADTTPINYLILIEEIDVLPKLYGQVVVPNAVREELLRPRAPATVREWMKRSPTWLDIRTSSEILDPLLSRLDDGERAAILLAEELAADQLMVDDSFARRIAQARGLSVIGTIGVLREAAERNLLDLGTAFERLQRTSFHVTPSLLARLLAEDLQ